MGPASEGESCCAYLPAGKILFRQYILRQAAITRMHERKKRRALLGDRKSAVAQNRMKSIASLASESPVVKKRKRGGGDGELRPSQYRPPADWESVQTMASARTTRTGRSTGRL